MHKSYIMSLGNKSREEGKKKEFQLAKLQVNIVTINKENRLVFHVLDQELYMVIRVSQHLH